MDKSIIDQICIEALSEKILVLSECIVEQEKQLNQSKKQIYALEVKICNSGMEKVKNE